MLSKKFRLRIRWERLAIILFIIGIIIFLFYSIIRSMFFTTRLPKAPRASIDTEYTYQLPNKLSGNLAYGEQLDITLYTAIDKICGGNNTGIDVVINHLENEISRSRYPLFKFSKCVDNDKLNNISVRYEQLNINSQAAEVYYLPIVYIYDGDNLLYNFTSIDDIMISNSAGYKFMGDEIDSIINIKKDEELKKLKSNAFHALLLEGKVNLFDPNISDYIERFTADQRQLLNTYTEGDYTNEQYYNLKRFNGHIADDKLELLIKKTLK